MGMIVDTLKATLEQMMEADQKLLANINQLQADISKTIEEFDAESDKLDGMSAADLAEFQRVCAMTEEEYLLYWQEA
jgi:hypothetical protein